jgi:hypothetical protein
LRHVLVLLQRQIETNECNESRMGIHSRITV